ncbi:hypothetical protein [Flagellimonas sp. CMM7]|uniref:hypothetical protein n=1 Tax=Flagellimonas sp. CMM7 TaxID=2654676 RepID=UPI0013D6832A|nr:hypothetical protein [Flagellimonas sp. CMM7]UII81309.1 hypothetical protein LV704_07270 [Flagellimonas sp. CMM7]
MQKSLYFVCPTDGLEPVINTRFDNRNYYYTSLGNSVVFDDVTSGNIRQLIQEHGITEVSFVLSINNPIVKDALGNQTFSDIRGLHSFYGEVLRQKGYSEVLCSEPNSKFTILSYHLNNKIKELQLVLDGLNVSQLKIMGKIYNKQEHEFYKIYSDLVCTEFFSLN